MSDAPGWAGFGASILAVGVAVGAGWFNHRSQNRRFEQQEQKEDKRHRETEQGVDRRLAEQERKQQLTGAQQAINNIVSTWSSRHLSREFVLDWDGDPAALLESAKQWRHTTSGEQSRLETRDHKGRSRAYLVAGRAVDAALAFEQKTMPLVQGYGGTQLNHWNEDDRRTLADALQAFRSTTNSSVTELDVLRSGHDLLDPME
ncbi:hypothetical protein [Streptomyces sp. NBC_00564]|uniref:hypothetical protein n=1 Tax=Streptomyces sp. NBC_00564 TaxID=2903663 RepID=UPI00352E2152|nr:hypothetical protein OG256_35720 [Streptomyces sp. NBC_00564]